MAGSLASSQNSQPIRTILGSETMNFLLQNGVVYNPRMHVMEKKNIAISNNMLVELDNEATYDSVIDAQDCIITTGLIDYHVHCYAGGCDFGLKPDIISPCCGITTVVDGGSCGVSNYKQFHEDVVEKSETRVLGYLLVASGGQVTSAYPENLDPIKLEEQRILDCFNKYPNEIVGLKIRLSKNIVDGTKAEKALNRTVEIADKAKTRVIVHVTDCSIPLDKVASILRPGDVICHIYQGKRNGCLDNDGKVLAGLWEAKKRGVLFDVGNGCNNFDLEVCKSAIKQGFTPDIISTDNTTLGCFIQPLHSLPRVLSKFIDMGLSLEEVLDAATISPAGLIGKPELGSMDIGTVADICILKKKEKEMLYTDRANHKFYGTQALVPMMTFKAGIPMYCQADFN